MSDYINGPVLAASLDELRYLVFHGMTGETGQSAYELAVERGFEGTVEEWLASLHGTDGRDGTDGKSLRVNSSGHVEYWDDTAQQWVDTGIEVEGVPGPEGSDGPAGKDGYSPAVTITTITGGHRITITDEDHPNGQSFDVMDGEDGDSSGARLLYYFPSSGKMQWYEHPGDESLQEITGEGVSDLVLVDGFAVFVYEPGIQRVYQLTKLPDSGGTPALFISDGNPKLKLTMNWNSSAVTKTDITEQKQVRYYRHYTAASGIFSAHEIAYEDNGSVLTADGEDIYNAIQAGIYPVIVDYGTSYPRVYKPEMVLNGTMVVFRSTDMNGSVAGLSLGWSDSIAVPFTAIGDMPLPNAQTDVGKVPTVNSSGGYTLQTPSGGGSETFTIHLTGNAQNGYAITESAAEIMAHYPNLVLVYDDGFVDNYYLVGARLEEEAMWGYLWFAQDQNWATDGTVSRSFVDLSIVWDTESPNYGVIAYRSSTNLRKLPQATSDQNGKILGVVNGDYALVDKELPAVTADDNGKVLGVVNGAWAAKADESYVTPQHFGAKGDGVTDDTAAINACFSSGASNIYFPSGTYLVDAHHVGFGHETEGGLRPQSNSVITLAPDAIIKCSTAPTDFYNILHFVNVENVIVQGGKIVGDKATHVQISQPTYEFGHGVGIQNSTNIVVRDMEICDCIGDGVILNYSGNHNVTLDNLTIYDCRRQGISLTSGDGVVITNCEIYGIEGTNPQAGIDIEPDGEKSVTNVVIDSCNIHDTVGASVIVTGVSNVIDQIHINGCLLDYALFLGGSNVTMDGGKSTRVCVKSNIAPIISACSIEEIWAGGGSAVFDGCNFISSGKEKFINVLSDVVSGNPVEGIVFSDCYFDVTDCTHFLYVPSNGVEKVKLIEFKDCSATVTHLVTGSYASSGFSNFLPSKMVISGSRFYFAAKIYQLFTMPPDKAATLEIADSEIINSNSYRTNYFLSGNGAYNVWIEHSKLMNYGNMLFGGGDATTGEVVLLNDTFDFSNPVGKVSADGVTITNISRENTKYLSGVTSNVQKQLDGIPTKMSDLENDSGYLTSVPVQSVNSKTGAVVLNASDVGALPDTTPIPAAVTEQTVAGWGFTKNTGTYSKPSGGIPKSDLAEAVQTSLGKADTALQEHQSLSGYATQSWVEGKRYLTLNDLPVYSGGVT